MPIIPPILPFAVLSCTALAAAAWCAAALFLEKQRHRTASRRVEEGCAMRETDWGASLEKLTRRVESLAAELRDIEEQLPNVRAGGAPHSKSALNLTKRAQALRMHRRGDPPDQIATLLELPVQEVGLLLKVHHIVMDNLENNTRSRAAS